jgi:hypothetical protein
MLLKQGEVSMAVIAVGASDDLPEARFAAPLTSHYRAIATVFPVFARLMERAKLNHIYHWCWAVRYSMAEMLDKVNTRAETQDILDRIAASLRPCPDSVPTYGPPIARCRDELLKLFPDANIDSGEVWTLVVRHVAIAGLVDSCQAARDRRLSLTFQATINRIDAFIRPMGELNKQLSPILSHTVPLPGSYQFGLPARAIGTVLVEPKPRDAVVSLGTFTEILVKTLTQMADLASGESDIVKSSYGSLVRTVEGQPLSVGTVCRDDRPGIGRDAAVPISRWTAAARKCT